MTVSPTIAPPPCCPWGLTYPLSWFQPPLYADTHVRVSSATSHLNFRIFSITYWVSLPPKCPTGTFTPNMSTAQHTTSAMNWLFLLYSLEWWYHLSPTFTSQTPQVSFSSSSHSLLRHLINSINFIFVVILKSISCLQFLWPLRRGGCPHLLSGFLHWTWSVLLLQASSLTQQFSMKSPGWSSQNTTDHSNALSGTGYWLPSICRVTSKLCG